MASSYSEILNNYKESFQLQVKKGPNSTDFLMYTEEGPCTTSVFDVMPFVHLIYFDINAYSLPGDGAAAPVPPIQLNYCIDGKTELMLDDNSYIYMNSNDFCLSRQAPLGDTYFPLKYYRGIALYFEDAFFAPEQQDLVQTFLPDTDLLRQRYFAQSSTFLGEAGPGLKDIMERLWKLYSDPEIFYKKLFVLELLHCLLEAPQPCREKNCVFYTNTQVAIAKKAEQILSADLSQHIPIRSIAAQFGVSETSLKNYFRGVYGKNISAYLRDLRMHYAEESILNTTLPISEIALQVGYTKQGKFAEVFRSVFGQSPLEYRRNKKLQNV